MGVDISELENAVTAFQKLKAAHSDWTDDKVKTEAMSQSLLNASDAAIHFAETTELTSENIGKFKVQQEAAIEAIEKGSLASKAASIGAGLLTGALTSVGVAIVSLLATQFLEWLDGVIHKQEKLAEKTEALRGEYESLTSEIKSLQSELNGIDAKISAMNGKPLTITEQGELTELQLQRKELEQILAVKEKLAEEKRTEASNAAVEYFQNESHYNDMYGGTFKGTILDDTKYKIESMKELQQQISDARETLQEYAETYGVTSYEYNTAKTDLDNLQGTYENLSAAVSKNMEAINEHRESLYGDGDEVKNTRDAIDELTNDWLHFDNELGEAYSKFLDKNSFDGLDRKFKQMATDGTLSADVIRQYEDFTRLLEQSGFTAEEAAQHYKAAGEAAQKAVPPSIDLSSADGLKTKLTEIIEKANVLSAMDINQAALSGGSEKQKEAWAELQAVMAETGMTLEQIQEKAVELGIVGADGASNITQAFIDANQNSAVFANNLSQITNRTDTLVSAYKELSKGQQLSSNVIMNLIQAYPQLETELTEYLAGLRSQQQIMADLEAVYQADSENWKALMLAKMGNSETFFQSIIVGNEGWVKEFYNQYGVDLSQCQTYAKAKLQIFQTITTAAYAAARATSGMGNMQGPLPYNAVSDELLAASDAIEQAINDLNNISMGSLEGQFHSLNSAIDSTTNKANDAAQALQSIASTSLSAINGLLDMTMSMLKQDLQSEKDRIDGELQGIEEEYQNSKDSNTNIFSAGLLVNECSKFASDTLGSSIKPYNEQVNIEELNYINSQIEIHSYKCFILSKEELGFTSNRKEGKPLPYFDDNISRIAKLNGNNNAWWSRTIESGLGKSIYVTASGNSGISNQGDWSGFRPAIAVSLDLPLNPIPKEDGSYDFLETAKSKVKIIKETKQTVGNIPSKSKVKLGRYGENELSWITTKDAEGRQYLRLDSGSVALTPFKDIMYDNKEPNNTDTNIRNYGNNMFTLSNLFQWLNSDKSANNWYTPQHAYDAPPPYANQDGFLKDWTEQEKQIILNKVWETSVPKTVSTSLQKFTAKVVVPSMTEVGISSNMGGSKLDIYANKSDRAVNDDLYWTRSSDPNNTYMARCVDFQGDGFSSNCIRAGVQVVPLVSIPVNTPVELGSDGTYHLLLDEMLPTVSKTVDYPKSKDFYARQFTYNPKKQYQTMLEGAIASPNLEPPKPEGQQISQLPSRSKVKLGKVNNTVLKWVVCKDTVDQSTRLILDADTVKTSDMGNKEFDSAEPTSGDSTIQKYGNGRYIYSNIHQWLNSDETANSWWKPSVVHDYSPSYLNQNGFLNKWSEKEKNTLELNTWIVIKGDKDGGGTETFNSKITLLSWSELTNDTNRDGNRLDIFNGDSDRNIGEYYWTRSGARAGQVKVVTPSGTITGAYPNTGLRVRPLCKPIQTTLVSAQPDSDGCYTLV